MRNGGNQYRKELQSDVLKILDLQTNTKERVGKNIEDKGPDERNSWK